MIISEESKSKNTISTVLIKSINMPSVIKHRQNQKLAVNSSYYRLIAKNNCEQHIVGIFHLDYLNVQSLYPPTINTICESLLGVAAEKRIRQGLKLLIAQGWLKTTSLNSKQVKNIICKKTPQHHPTFNHNCSWCGCSTFILQSHHYPIPKEHEGTETVDICANCHFEFHMIQETLMYAATDKLKQFFELNLEKADCLLADGFNFDKVVAP